MREIVRHEPGTFCWPELATTDPDSAKILYGSLFGWAFDDQVAASGTTHTIARLAGRDMAALYALERSQRVGGVSPAGTPTQPSQAPTRAPRA